MKKVIFILFLTLFVLNGIVFAETPEESLKKTYPKLTFKSIKKTEVAGLYEIVTGDNILYYHPKTAYLFFGEIWTKEGKSLTAERMAELVAQKTKDLPLNKAVKIGSGQNTVIEFTDPDCPFCRKTADYFRKRNNVTRYIFFNPLTQIHPQAEDKVKYILCAVNKAEAYEEVMSGKIDSKKIDVCKDEKVSELLNEHKQMAARVGVSGTPTLIVNGQLVVGANIPLIEKFLK